MVTRKRAIFYTILLILFFISFVEGAQENIPVKAIVIRGNRVIEEATIRHQIKSREGEPFTPFRVRQDISNIYKIGYIEDIQVESETFEGGIKLTYLIKEKPWIKSIIFEGNKKVKTETLKEKIDLTEKAFLDKGAINQNLTKLIQYYQGEGFYLVAIDYSLEELEEGWVNLHFTIEEGKKVKIRRIVFFGNDHFKNRILKKQIATRTYGFFSFLSKKGFLNKEVLEEDRIRIQNFYLDRGFIHCQVSPPHVELDKDKKSLTLQFFIQEGDLYKVNEVSITGNLIFPTEELLKIIHVKYGDVYSRTEISRDLTRITDVYGEKGYLTSDVFPMISEDTVAKSISVNYKIKEGEPSYLRWINIIGNTKTRDKVVRREILIKEGDLYTQKD